MKTEFVFIPGLHGTSGMFRPILRLLPGRAFDLPKDGPQTYARLLPWLNSRPFPKSYVLVGESFGGPLSLLHAAGGPRGLKGVALLGSFARMGLPFSRALSYLLPPLPLASRFFRRFNQRALFSGSASRAQLDFFRKETSETSPWIYRARFQEVMRCDVRPVLPAIQVPVLSIRAIRDQMVPDRAEGDLHALRELRQASIDSPHVIAGTRPRQLAKLLLNFSKTLGAKK